MEKKNGLSIAVMLSIVGLLGLGFGTGVGMLLDGRDMATSLVCGAAVLLVGGIGLYLAVRAKTADSEFNKWRKFEYLGLAMCIAAIAFAAQPTIYAANFIFSNRSLCEAGDRDIASIGAMIGRFKAQESERLSITREGLENYIVFRPSNVSSGLQQYIAYEVMHGQAGVLNTHVLNDYVAEKSYLIDHGNLQEDLFGRYQHELDILSAHLSGFDFSDFATMAVELTALSDSVGANLTALSRNFNFGTIAMDDSGEYTYDPSLPNVYDDRATSFGNEYSSMFAPAPVSMALFVVLSLLFILDYILEFRSLRVPVGTGPKISDKDGIPL